MMKIKLLYIIAIVVGFTACKDYDPDVSTSDTSFYADLSTLDILELRGFTLFVDAVAHAGVEGALSGSDTVTVFAPTNAAMSNYLSSVGATSVTDINATDLARVLRYHITASPFTSASTDASLTSAVSGKDIYPTYSVDGSIGLNGKATVVEADLYSQDGVIHGISRVLSVPETSVFDVIDSSPNHATLSGLITRVGLDAALSGAGSFTVLAPSDDAFTAAGYDAATLAGLSDNVVDSILRFHVISSRTYQTEFADGKYVTLLGAEEDGFQEWVVSDGAFNYNGVEIDSDSANFTADNGVVHEIDVVLDLDEVIADYLGDWVALNDAATEPLDYTSLDQQVTILNFDFGNPENPVPGDFADGDEIQDWLETYTFDGSQPFRDDQGGPSSGVKVTSVNGSEFYTQHTGDGVTWSLNNQGFLSSSSTGTYNGFRNRMFAGAYPTPLPEEDITDVLEDQGYTLLAAMLRITGKDADADAADVTFYAVSNAAITFYFDYTDPADMDTLSAGGAEDVEVTDAFTAFLENQMVPGEVTSALIIGADLPEQTLLNGETIDWILIGGVPVVVTDSDDPANNNLGLIATDIWANNGVIHEMEDIFPE
ncbi:fasciclin domain-containing protein [Ekhidna sp. To15]|uniref:fasciclin domain-containing protein n=1 Tax=Ekhidna sp. To15 TaxID=3395267 RepID=UPI003F52382B